MKSPIVGLKDSKKLSKIQKQKLAEIINLKALAVGLGWVTPRQVDLIGLTQAVRLAMELAIGQITTKYNEIVVDGHYNFLAHHPNSRAVIGADDLISSVSAASIIAKVARDQYMVEASVKYPEYGFEKHVGYGTKLHSDMLEKHGVCAIHRRSYAPIKQALLK